MSGDNNNGELALTDAGDTTTPAAAEVIVPNLKNTKRVDCGQGRFAIVRCASKVDKSELCVIAGGNSGPVESRYAIWCARWGIVSLQGDWGSAPDGKPWTKVNSEMGKVQPKELVATLSGVVLSQIAFYVNVGAYLTEVQGKD
jgi:hypothetical protein